MQQKKQKVHFIAIGGSVMHNLAIALKKGGHEVTGSDDEIFDPARTELANAGLLPATIGWQPEILNASYDFILLGMHASKDNPELLRAQELKLKIVSFPEFIYEQSKDKQRVVIAGSHGKTTITSIIIHVLNHLKRKFDYVVGAKVKGLDATVKLSDAPIIIIEGDEYLSSALDPTPKFIRYQHHVGIISGIAWDHANVFPTEEEYVKEFDRFADQTPKGGILFYNELDSMALMIGKKERFDVLEISYKSHPHASDNNGHMFLTNGKERYPVRIIGSHNLQNISAAKELLKKLGVSPEQFFSAISTFEGAAGRLHKVAESADTIVYKDFAHAPSKVKATVKALKETYPGRDLVACVELHTFSSLNKKFLPQYKDGLKGVHTPVIFYNPEKVKAKNLEELSEADIRAAFVAPNATIFTDAKKLEEFLLAQSWKNKNLLMMSSGDFGGLNISFLAEKILS